MENGDIPDANIQASSYYDSRYYPRYGRLNGGRTWKASGPYYNHHWIQADIGYQTYVSGVATQGGGCCWAPSFKVSTFSMATSDNEVYIDDGGGQTKVFFLQMP